MHICVLSLFSRNFTCSSFSIYLSSQHPSKYPVLRLMSQLYCFTECQLLHFTFTYIISPFLIFLILFLLFLISSKFLNWILHFKHCFFNNKGTVSHEYICRNSFMLPINLSFLNSHSHYFPNSRYLYYFLFDLIFTYLHLLYSRVKWSWGREET